MEYSRIGPWAYMRGNTVIFLMYGNVIAIFHFQVPLRHGRGNRPGPKIQHPHKIGTKNRNCPIFFNFCIICTHEDTQICVNRKVVRKCKYISKVILMKLYHRNILPRYPIESDSEDRHYLKHVDIYNSSINALHPKNFSLIYRP